MIAYLACVVGVIFSVLIPALAKAVKNEFGTAYGSSTPGQGILPPKPSFARRILKIIRKIWPYARPYAILCVFSTAVALVIVAFLSETLNTWRAGFMAGYLWDSTLQKITDKP